MINSNIESFVQNDIFRKAKQNWFQITVILLLILCYIRLGKIKENTFYTADTVEDSTNRIVSSNEDYLNSIEINTKNTWTILEDRLD